MSKLTFYEQVGIVIPGSVLLFGLVLYFPALRDTLAKDGISVGELGVFVLLGYAAGHLVAGLGNIGERLLWSISGGMPTQWVVKPTTTLLSPQQLDALAQKIESRLGLAVQRIRGMDRAIWGPISRQMHADVVKNGRAERIEVFNGNYGLSRGLAAACLALALVALWKGDYHIAIGLFIASAMYTYRAYRFGSHYARELYAQFLVLPDWGAPPNAT